MKVAICICTCQRPAGLRRQLKAVAAADKPAGTEIIVVDNGCEETTAEIVFREVPGARLVFERLRGICFARDTAFHAALGLGADLICTVDDDDEVAPDWLTELLKTYRQSGADLILGGLVDEFGRHRPHPRSGSNALQSRRILERLGAPWIDPATALVGGSDRYLFEAILAAGGSLARCPASKVRRYYGAHRMTAYGRFLHGIKFGYNEAAIPDENLAFLTTEAATAEKSAARRARKTASAVLRFLARPCERQRRAKVLVSLGRLIGLLLRRSNRKFDYYSSQTAERR